MKKKYIEYDVDETFDTDINKASEDEIANLLKTGKIKCAYVTKTITSGKVKEVEIYPEYTSHQLKKQKEVKRKSNRSRRNLNDKNARKSLNRLINCNFGDNDIWATLTYDDEHLPNTEEEALKKFQYYIRKINKYRKKNNMSAAKYIYITEYNPRSKKRFHHHMIIDHEMSMDELESLWPYGRRNNTRRIKEDKEGLNGLANYLTKEKDREKGKKRWNCSKGLKQPKITKSYTKLSMKKIREMISNQNVIRETIEKLYPGLIYCEERALFNQFNSRTYFYVRLANP